MAERKPSTRRRVQPAGETSTAGTGPRNVFAAGHPSAKLTRVNQAKTNEDNQQQGMTNLIETWLQRLQLISVITTFFASTEAGFLGKTVPDTSDTPLSIGAQVTNISFMGALIIHASAAIISFIGAFFLIQYKLIAAQEEEDQAEKQDTSPTSVISDDVEKMDSPTSDDLRTDPIRRGVKLVQVGPFQRPPPTLLLSRCHLLCVLLSFLGFILALMGLMAFAWDRLPLNASIFSSICMGLCLVLAVLIVITPSTKTSYIYYNHK